MTSIRTPVLCMLALLDDGDEVLLPTPRFLSYDSAVTMCGGVPVSVPSESMLSLGAMISMTTQASDIAATIADVVRKIAAGNIEGVSPITQLSAITVKTNGDKQVVSR